MRGVRTPFLKLLGLAVFLAAAVFLVPSARADGKMFAVEIADVSGAQIPDQSALICWNPATKTQTLAIETRFIGKGTEFGWVVPLPSRPEVKPGTKGMFPSLRGMFAPVVQTRGAGAAPFLICLVIFVLVMLYSKSAIRWVIVVLLILFMMVLLTPSLGSAGAGAGGAVAEPEYLDRRIVGDFEVTTLESPEGTVVVDWLRAHKFHVPAAAETVIDQYAKEKWSFVATRLSREIDSAEASTAHPLVFTFTTEVPVYPMRLTGADAKQSLSVELFVFGPSSAGAKGFDVAAAGPVRAHDPGTHPYHTRPSRHSIEVAHAAIGPLVEGAAFATRLTATLKPAEMGRDVQLGWTSGGATGRSAQSWQTAGGIGLDVGLGVMFIVLCIVGHLEQTRNLPRRTAVKWALLAAGAIGLIVFAAIPKVGSLSVRDTWRTNREIADDLASISGTDLRHRHASVSVAEARSHLDQYLASHSVNRATPFVRGDSPGQFDVRVFGDMIWLVGVTSAGAEEWRQLWHIDDLDTD